MNIHIDTYFDVTCSECGKSRSTDFGFGMEIYKNRLLRLAYRDGWKCKGGKTLCPICAKK